MIDWFIRRENSLSGIDWKRKSEASQLSDVDWGSGGVPRVTTLPPDVTAAGYTSLVMEDDFLSTASIDMPGTGAAGYKWYRRLPWSGTPTPTSAIQVANSVLTFTQTFENWNQGLYSVDAYSGQGSSWQYGYFEARMRFNPANATASNGFPAFWMLGRDHVTDVDNVRWGELDIFEAYHDGAVTYNGAFYGTIHDWLGGTPSNTDRGSYGNHISPALGANFTVWHDYAALWTPGRVRWYFDGVKVLDQAFSVGAAPVPNTAGHPAGIFSIFDTKPSGLALVIGTGVGYPLDIDRVRVWQ